MRKTLLGIFVVFMLLSGCMPPQLQVDYGQTSVPEEGGINFTRITGGSERIVSPTIFETQTGLLRWDAAPMIAVSNNGEKIAYLRRENNLNNIIIRNIAGGQATVQRTFNRNVRDMTFSPDDSWLAFTEVRSNNYIINLIRSEEGAAIRQLTSTSDGNSVGPSFSHDGSSVYYTRVQGQRLYVWNTDLNTSIQTQYSEGFTPVLTPDGEHMIITRNSRDGEQRGEIWMVNLRTGSETLILNDSTIGFSSPDISPDGKTIVCVGTTPASSNTPQNLDIYTVNIDGTNVNQLTFHGGHDLSPIWSHDGRHIYFLAQRGSETGSFNVWRMNYDD